MPEQVDSRRFAAPDAAAPNPRVFVVGCARSGTTLLQRMLDNHPMLAVANDTHFIPWAIAGAETENPAMTPDLAARVAGYRRFHRFELTRDAVDAAAAGAPDYAAFVGRLYDAYAALKGKPFAGEKTPEYVRHIPLLARLFPAARFVHIVRDGRDVCLSVLKWAVKDRPPDETGATVRGPARRALWAEDPVGATALWWADHVMEGAAAGDALGPGRSFELRYEDLVAAPEPVLARIAAFLGLPDAPEMAAYHEGKRQKRRAGLSAKKAWLPATRGLRDWRRQMSAEDAALFEDLAGDALLRFGYAREATVAADPARAAICRRIWAEDAPRPAGAAP